MKAEAKSLRFLGEGKKLSVPFFQRRYVWEKSNWEELLETFRNEEVMPFLGSIILKEVSSKESIIVDGQQRLTTITILAKAIYDCLTNESKGPGSGIRNYIESFLYYRNNAADDFSDSHVRVDHSRTDQNDYNMVIKSGMLDDTPEIDINTTFENSGNILKCYKYYCEKLKNYSDNDLKALFNAIFDDRKKAFVLIELEHGDINEQTIFDTINRAGIRLSTADIIKNNLFKRLLEAAGTGEEHKKLVLDTYENSWENVFNSDQHTSELWDTERVFGNVKHNNLEFLLYCVACIKWGEDGDMFSKLENVFERETAKMGFSDLCRLVLEIKDYANIFKRYILDLKDSIEDEDKNHYFNFKNGVERLLLILQKFGVQMFYPYVLMRIKDVNQNDNDQSLLDDFRILESFIMRRKISSKGTHDYTSKCYLIIKYGINKLIETDLGNDESEISDSDVKRYLSFTKDDAAKMILFCIELYRRRLPEYDINELEYKYTLEHIMPRKWETNWSDVPIVNNGEALDHRTEEGRAFRDACIQSIGNKTLLKSSLNSTLKNSSYSSKINGINDKNVGYKSHTTLLLTKEIVDKASEDPVWDEGHIIARTGAIYKEFIEIWPSYKERIDVYQQDDSNQGEDASKYTKEQLEDPLKLLKAMGEKEANNEKEVIYGTDVMVSLEEFVRRVNVQSETIEKYIREGKIVPDRIVPLSGHRSTKYFFESSLLNYIHKFGWGRVTDENRKEIFMRMVEIMDMSYSYKPVLIKAMLQLCDIEGVAKWPAIAKFFLDFYMNRRHNSLPVEKTNSVFSKPNCTFEEAEKVIKIYPYKRFSDIGAIKYNCEMGELSFNSSIWNKLTENEKTRIIAICDLKLEEYYSRF